MTRIALLFGRIPAQVITGLASAAPHPFHDDGGAVNWKSSLAAAQEASKLTGKPIFIEAARESCGICKRVAATTLRDPKVSQTAKRYFISIAVDVDNPPPAVRDLFSKVSGNTLPFIMFVSDSGQFIQGSSGYRSPTEFHDDLEKVLKSKGMALPVKSEGELTKQTDVLAKALEGKSYAKATPALTAINKLKGYSPLKDKVFDLLDSAQEEATKKVAESVELATQDKYTEARGVLTGVAKEYAGLPIADQVKDQLAALKLLESASQTITGKKGMWKQAAVQQLGQVVAKYGDTPFANLAVKRMRELAPPEKSK